MKIDITFYDTIHKRKWTIENVIEIKIKLGAILMTDFEGHKYGVTFDSFDYIELRKRKEVKYV